MWAILGSNLDFWPSTLQMLRLCFPLKAGSCTRVARCLWLGEAEHCSLAAWLLLPMGTRVDAGSMVLLVRLGSLKAVLDQPLVYHQYGITSCHVLWQTHARLQSLLVLAVLPEVFSISVSLKQHLWLKAVSAAAAVSSKFSA